MHHVGILIATISLKVEILAKSEWAGNMACLLHRSRSAVNPMEHAGVVNLNK